MENAIPTALMRPLPWLTARTGYLARQRLQDVMGEYYTAEHYVNDPSVGPLMRERAKVLRDAGCTGREIGQCEAFLPLVAMTNTAPAMFWMICYVFHRPELVERLREEITPLIEHGPGDVATVDISKLEIQAPLLVSCYREVIRLVGNSVHMRRTLTDTTITDNKGNSFFLQKGVDVQIAAGVTHSREDVWGDDALDFDPERFMGELSEDKETGKFRKAAYSPFGGGRHLCPGRYFAFAEILAVMSTFIVGFELEPLGGAFDSIKPGSTMFASAVRPPVKNGEGLGLRVKRRAGWEKTHWRFDC